MNLFFRILVLRMIFLTLLFWPFSDISHQISLDEFLWGREVGHELLKPEGYISNVDYMDAKSVLKIKKINLPKKIGNHFVYYRNLIDKSHIIAELYIKENNLMKREEIGIINLDTSHYTKYFDLGENSGSPIYLANEDYIVLRIPVGTFRKKTAIYLYKVKEGILEKVFDHSESFDGSGYDALLNPNNITMMDDNIYFDYYYEDSEGSVYVALLKYNVLTGEIETVMENAQNPMYYKGEIVFFIKEDGKFGNIVNREGELVYKKDISIIKICNSDNHLFCLENKYTDDNTLTTIFQLRDLGSNREIFCTNRSVTMMDVTDYFVLIYDYDKNLACLYSIDKESILIFPELGFSYNSFIIKDNYGIIKHRDEEDSEMEYYFFEQKAF